MAGSPLGQQGHRVRRDDHDELDHSSRKKRNERDLEGSDTSSIGLEGAVDLCDAVVRVRLNQVVECPQAIPNDDRGHERARCRGPDRTRGGRCGAWSPGGRSDRRRPGSSLAGSPHGTTAAARPRNASIGDAAPNERSSPAAFTATAPSPPSDLRVRGSSRRSAERRLTGPVAGVERPPPALQSAAHSWRHPNSRVAPPPGRKPVSSTGVEPGTAANRPRVWSLGRRRYAKRGLPGPQ